MEAGLRLLMCDGAIHVFFHPRLTSEQYAELMAVVEIPSTMDELRETLKALAKKWGSEVKIEEQLFARP